MTIAKLQTQAEALVKKESAAVIEKIRGLMEKHGLTTADIDAHVGGGKKRGPKQGVKAVAKPSAPAAKYSDPKTGATWTGHGRAPAWIANAKDRSKFLVEGNAAASVKAAKKTTKVGNYVRGPQPALYRDPKTGATWSGRGRAPAWLAGAKDRSKFLIAEAVEPAAAPKVKAVKAVTAKGPVGKKAAATKKVPATKQAAANTVAATAPKAASKSGATAKALVARKALMAKRAVKTAGLVNAAVQAPTEVASAAAAA